MAMMKMKMMGCGPRFQDKEFEMLTFYLARRIKRSFSKQESTARRADASYVLGMFGRSLAWKKFGGLKNAWKKTHTDEKVGTDVSLKLVILLF